jgi:hypothetical protein
VLPYDWPSHRVKDVVAALIVLVVENCGLLPHSHGRGAAPATGGLPAPFPRYFLTTSSFSTSLSWLSSPFSPSSWYRSSASRAPAFRMGMFLSPMCSLREEIRCGSMIAATCRAASVDPQSGPDIVRSMKPVSLATAVVEYWQGLVILAVSCARGGWGSVVHPENAAYLIKYRV